ncbi:Ig-like virion protein [Erwinia phage pEa_SNUABM_5]|uniref:Ig-like virion protein n=1 Tax=Erwinia phage pEa_SNUABM_5 TaxID=2797313 RepID=A0A7T8EQ14_9CAUD|nr:Ig-like virion protein [Erwinia phage pEa_SNUABM_5]QQO90252.1 Ig-like virion protein [Erwinia phage pEa_SNUABM_5]
MKSETEKFFIDFLQDNPAWEELFETMGEANDALNLATIQQLLDVRKITSSSPVELAEESLRLLGINISRDMMTYRIDTYRRIFDTLPDYNLVSGTSSWPKFVSMLLGGQFESQRLYTADYQTFLPKPLGALVQDGGQWYRTTHVDLDVDAHIIDAGLDLTVDQEAQADIVAALQQIGMTEQQAIEWHVNHVGFDPVNKDLTQRTARNVMLNRRITKLFYQWAPIEDVLHAVNTTVSLTMQIFLTAHTVVEPVRRFFVGRPLTQSLEFIEPEYIHGGQEIVFGVLVRYSDNTERTEECYVEDNPNIQSRNGNAVVFAEPNAILAVDLIVTYKGTRHQISTRLFPLGIEPDPVEIYVAAPMLYGNSTNRLRVYGKYKDGTTRDLTGSNTLQMEPSLGTLDGTSLVLPSVVADTTMSIKAVYKGQADISIVNDFAVLKSVRALTPVELSVLVPDVITQGVDVELQCVCTYNDKTSKIVTAQLMSTSRDANIVQDVLKSKIRRQDYMTNIVAKFDDGGSVQTTAQVKLRAPVNLLAAVDIVIPDTIMERDNITPKAMGLYVLETATQQQIIDRDPAVIVAYQELRGRWFTSEDLSQDIYGLQNVNPETGEFQAPWVDTGYRDYSLHVTVIDGQLARTFSEIFPVYDTVLMPRQVDITSGTRVASGDFISLPTVCLWSNGKSYAAAATMTVEYVPSASAVEEARTRTIELQKQAVILGQDPTVYDPDAPDYSQWVSVEISNGVGTLFDPILDRSQPIQILYFKGDLHGVARVHITYKSDDGTTITNSRDFQVVPVRALVESILIEMPDEVIDQSRTFARLFATYADGVQEYVQAAHWSGVWPDQDTDPYQVLRFVPGTYSGASIVEAVHGRVPTDIKDFRQMRISKLPMFDDIGDMNQLATTMYDGAIVQIGKCNEQTNAAVRARFYRIENQLEIVIVPTPQPSINTILNSRIEGATTISAAVRLESYALVNTYETGGIVRQLDGSYAQGEKKTFDLEVSADWSIVNSWYFTRDGNNIILEPTDDVVAEIDDNGDVIPSVNANCAIRIRAQFICDGYAIEKFLTVYITLANTYLQSGAVLGPEIFWDLVDKNPTFEYANGRWYVPYSLRILLKSGEEVTTTAALWSIGDDTDVDSVSIDPLNGHLYLADQQRSDGRIRINAVYSAINPETQASETLNITRVIQMHSTRTILTGAIELPASNIEPNKTYQAIAEYERRDGQTGTSVVPDSDTVKFVWSVISSVPGFQINTQTGEFSFIPQKNPQTVKIECMLTEQRTNLTMVQEVTCPGIGFPQDLAIVGFTNVRDDSSMQMKASLGRTGTFVKDDVTTKTLWQTTNSKGDVVTIPGITVNAQTGMLTINQLLSDADFGVRATYIENSVRLTQVHYMRAFSSYPRFGTAQFGVNNIAGLEQAVTNRMRSSNGGTFVLTPKTDEYGYFAARADYGRAVFAAGADAQGNVNPDWNGFDAAKWPVTGDDGQRGPLVLRKVYDNLTENINVYRTNARAFGSAVITVRYT